MQPDGLLFPQDASGVRHDPGLVQRRLPIHEQGVARPQMPEDRHRRPTALDVGGQLLSKGLALVVFHLAHVLDGLPAAGLWHMHLVSTRVYRAALHQLAELLGVVQRGDLRVIKAFGDGLRDADLRRLNVEVRRDDRARGEVHALAHHFHAEDALLLLEFLPDTGRRQSGVLLALAAVEVGIHRQLQVLDVFLHVADHLGLPVAFLALRGGRLVAVSGLGAVGFAGGPASEELAQRAVLADNVQDVRGRTAQHGGPSGLGLRRRPKAVRRDGQRLQEEDLRASRPGAWHDPPQHLLVICEDLPDDRAHIAGFDEELLLVAKSLHEHLREPLFPPLRRLCLANRAGAGQVLDEARHLFAGTLHRRRRRGHDFSLALGLLLG
mmetsp:Transcript_89861/g.275081  ORF Transcript_89861/g.275081 Transcript_89861/m.275081 type:complete len:380 (+) Transcript_89861:4092-5231(+)